MPRLKNKKKIDFLCTAFRDGFQSAFGGRVLSKDYMPVVKEAVQAGITHIEAGGGASFQAAFFYNNENAFSVMDTFRQTVGNDVNLQTLSRGVNVVALDSQSSDLIRLHAKLFKKHGMTTIRNFDALNDPDNLLLSAQAIQNAGLKHELAVSMMSLPPACAGAHTADFYENRLKQFIKAGVPFDSLCFKDASGTAVPKTVYETIRRARKLVGSDMRIVFHSHETAGTGLVCYLAAIDAGADQVDLSLAPVSGGTCQPDIATLWQALRGSDVELACDVDAVMRVEESLKEALKEYFIPPEALHADPRIPFSPMPGGALTANTQMLRDNKLMDKYGDIINAMEEVVKKGGFGTSVTPVSQFYFQQAFNNVMFGPWQKIAEGYGKMVLGYFGKTPVKPDAEVMAVAEKQLGMKPTKESVLTLNDANPQKSVRFYQRQLTDAGLSVTDENIFIAAACGQKGIDFLQGKGKVQIRLKKDMVCAAEKAEKLKTQTAVPVYVNGQAYQVQITGQQAVVNGVMYDISAPADIPNTQKKEEGVSDVSAGGVMTPIESGVPGAVVKLSVAVGDKVSAGQEVALVEVMKMQTVISASSAGVVSHILVQVGEVVEADTVLIEIKA